MPHRAPRLFLPAPGGRAMAGRGAGPEGPGGDLPMSNDSLERLADVIAQRRHGDPDKSYVARLFAKGNDAILKKIGEEATEVVMAAKDGERGKIVAEVADLWFHTLVALAAYELR